MLDDPVTHVAVDPGSPCLHRAGPWPHLLLLGPCDVVRLWCGALATTADRTAIDLARTLARLDVLPVLDAALAAGAGTPDSPADELARHVGMPDVRQARELVPLARTGADPPQESRLRLHCHDAGLPAPTLQLPVPDRHGRPHRWLDLGWEEERVGLEYDGGQAHGADRRHRDRRRHNVLEDAGWAMFYATDHDVLGDPRVLMAQVERALARRSRPDGRRG